MKKFKHLKKSLMFSLGLAALMLQAAPVNAQVINHGLLKNPYKEQNGTGAMLKHRSQGGYSVATEQFGSGTSGAYNIGTEQFGNDAPLGGGLFIMAAAGAAYAFKKRKMNK